MRHLKKGRKLSRNSSHRKATLQALSVALITEHRIRTTHAKAKELRTFVEPLITRAKVDTSHNRRLVFSKLQDKYAVQELFEEVGPLAKDRPGGYTRVIKIGSRPGDSAELAVIELVDYNDIPPESGKDSKKRTRRAGKSNKPTPAEPQTESKKESDTAPVEEESVEEVKTKAVAEASEEESQASEETEKQEDKPLDVSSFTVDEVKEKLDELDVEEAKQFVGDDERVTVQRALEKKIKDEEESSDDSGDEEDKQEK